MSGPLPDRLSFLTERPFAHRGLHGADRDGRHLSENGMAAFDAAMAAGLGIECDVRTSRDNVAFIFHDATLDRMAGQADAIDMHEAADLDRISLPDGGHVPRLAALLDRCGDTVPMLVEIKGKAGSCRPVLRDIAAHPAAPVAIMSFNPWIVRWFARYAPHVVRGLVFTQRDKGKVRAGVEGALALWLANPDFVACDIRDLPSDFSRRARQRGRPVLTWTVRTPDERACAGQHADQIIFEPSHD